MPARFAMLEVWMESEPSRSSGFVHRSQDLIRAKGIQGHACEAKVIGWCGLGHLAICHL